MWKIFFCYFGIYNFFVGTLIEFKNVEKIYPDGFCAVSNINLKINNGEFCTLLGPSGCGKTTILKMLGGFETVSGGKIFINGIVVNDLPANKRPTSTVFQDYALFPNMTVEKNIMFGLKLMRIPLNKSEISDKTKQLGGLKTLWKKKAGHEIKIRNKNISTLENKIMKVYTKYSKDELLYKYRDMRLNSYQTQVYKYEDAKRKDLKDDGVYLDNKLSPTSTKWDKLYINLKNAFNKKKSIDKEIDFLKAKLNDEVSWLSYWENYVTLKTEEFEKKHTTRLLKRNEIKERVKKVIEKVGLVGKENKYPGDLSGGMQQRVALARSIVIEPEIILLDEPLSALDAKVRQEMQLELKRLHKELKITFILVTHDQEEALSLSDKVVVMSNGRIQQVGTPHDIYDEPNNKWVASFIGKANFFIADADGENGFKFNNIKFIAHTKSLQKYKFAYIIVRPEDINIVKKNEGFINATIKNVIYKGLFYEIIASVQNKNEIIIETTNKYSSGEEIGLKWDTKDVHLLPCTDVEENGGK